MAEWLFCTEDNHKIKKLTLICLNSNVVNIRPAEVSLSSGCLTLLNCFKGGESMRVGVEFRYQHPSLSQCHILKRTSVPLAFSTRDSARVFFFLPALSLETRCYPKASISNLTQ